MKIKLKVIFISIIISLFLISCSSSTENDASIKITLDQLYQEAINDAIFADSTEISYDLIAVVPENDYLTWKVIEGKNHVLAVSFAFDTSRFHIGETVITKWGTVWISLDPEIKNKLLSEKTTNDSILSLRASQIVGIPHSGTIERFVEFWVLPEDMFRPSPDNEITDNTSLLYFPDNTDPEYIKWFNQNIIYSYFPEIGWSRYPWTRLGYTYDWGSPDNEFGVSEFVVKKDSKVIVKGIYTPSEYISE